MPKDSFAPENSFSHPLDCDSHSTFEVPSFAAAAAFARRKFAAARRPHHSQYNGGPRGEVWHAEMVGGERAWKDCEGVSRFSARFEARSGLESKVGLAAAKTAAIQINLMPACSSSGCKEL